VRCKQVREKLVEYELGALEEGESGAIAEHLQSCADCRRELEAMKRTSALLGPIQPSTPPPHLWLGIRERLRPRRRRLWASLPQMRWQQALAAAAALLIIVGGFGWMALRRPAIEPSQELLASDYQQQQIVAQWAQPLADDAALGILLVSLENGGEGDLW